MKKLALSVAAAAAAVALAPVASAAPTITVTTGSGAFSNPNLTCAAGVTLPCTFTDTLTFTTPAGYNLSSATISSSMAGDDATTDVNFTSVMLNNVEFITRLTGNTEFREIINQALIAGATNTLVISGTTGGNGSYGGSLTFTNANAVPEPAAWALMILGFSLAGYALRRRPSVRFAQAN